MIRTILRLLLLSGLCAMPLVAQPQQGATPKLSNVQKLGQRIFEQRCSVCHVRVLGTSKSNGPQLYRELVEGHENQIATFISNGVPALMPGFKYGLKHSEINAIVQYLKTVERPAQGH